MTKENNFVEIEIATKTYRFSPEAIFYHQYLNDIARGKLAKGSNNYCFSAIHQEDRSELQQLVEQNPGAAIQIATILGEHVAPELDIQVKKP